MSKKQIRKHEDHQLRINGWYPFRIQDVSINGTTNPFVLFEMSNDTNSDEYNETSVSVNITSNEYGSCRNLRMMIGATGLSNMVISSFEYACPFISYHMPYQYLSNPDTANYIDRTLIAKRCFLESINWVFSVNGFATEEYSFIGDELEWHTNTEAVVIPLLGFFPQHPSTYSGYAYFPIGVGMNSYELLGLYIDGIKVTDNVYYESNVLNVFGSNRGMKVGFSDSGVTRLGNQYIAEIYQDTASVTKSNSSSTIGSINRGRINIYLESGNGNISRLTRTNFLRLQDLNITLNFNREPMYEMCSYVTHHKPITNPVVTISANGYLTDLEDFCKIAGYNHLTISSLDLASFASSGQLKVEIYNKHDSDPTRRILKSLTSSGLRLISYDIGSNLSGVATFTMDLECDNILISGYGLIGTGQHIYPTYGSISAIDE